MQTRNTDAILNSFSKDPEHVMTEYKISDDEQQELEERYYRTRSLATVQNSMVAGIFGALACMVFQKLAYPNPGDALEHLIPYYAVVMGCGTVSILVDPMILDRETKFISTYIRLVKKYNKE